MSVYYQDDLVTLHHGDCFDVLTAMPDASVDAIVTDPPYGLEFMGKEWDRFAGKVSDRDFKGFVLSQQRTRNVKCPDCDKWAYDHPGRLCECGGIRRAQGSTFQAWCEVWSAECLRVLKPGGHLLAFGGTRTWHRLAVAVEDAGFELRDSIAWLYGSGFPKSLDVSKAIDKSRRRDYVIAAVGLGLEIPGNNLHDWTTAEHSPGDAWWEKFKAHLSPETWGEIERQVLKQRSRKATGRMAQGEGGYAFGEDFAVTVAATDAAKQWAGWGTALKPAFEPIVVARKPLAGTVAANVLQHGVGALNVDACRVPGEAWTHPGGETQGRRGGIMGEIVGREASESNAAGRWPTNVVLDDGQAAELDRQTGVTESRIGKPRGAASGDGWGMTATGAEYADAGGASRFFPTFHYEAKAPTAERPRGDDGTAHPTVKPLDLMRWLVRLVTPPGGLVLDPFLGSGTTAEACVIEGFRCIGIEREEAYMRLAVTRLSKPIETVLDFGEIA